MPNGRCRRHGGKSTGPHDQRGNANALVHGIYSKFVSKDAIEEAAALEDLPPEQRAKWVRLLRERKLLKALDSPDAPLAAIERLAQSVLADLDPEATEVGGDAETSVLVVEDDSEGWLDGDG